MSDVPSKEEAYGEWKTKLLDLAVHKPAIGVSLPVYQTSCKVKGCNKMKFSMDFKQALKIATKVFTKVLPPSTRIKIRNIVKKTIMKPVDAFSKALKGPSRQEKGKPKKEKAISIIMKGFKSLRTKNKHFFIGGTHTSSGSSVLVYLVKSGKETPVIMVGVSITSKLISQVCKKLFKADPFEKIPLLSNMVLAMLVSSGKATLPDGLGFAGSMKSEMRKIDNAGICVTALINAPDPVKCKPDAICSMFSKVISNLRLKGCFTTKYSEIEIGIKQVNISKSVNLKDIKMKFKATYAPPKLELTATSTLSIQMGKNMANQPHWVDFTGAITLATGPTPLVKLDFVMTNFWPNSFGIPNVNLDNLILSASASPVPPWIGELLYCCTLSPHSVAAIH